MTGRSGIESTGDFECVVFGPSAFEDDVLETVTSSLGEGRCREVEDFDELSETDEPVDRRVVLFRRGGGARPGGELAESLRDADCASTGVCVVDDGDWQGATAALREGAADYLFVEQLQSSYLEETLYTAIERDRISERDRRVQRELEERSTELMGVNALANGVSNVLDRSIIVRRGLWVFVGVCQQDAAGLVEIRPPPELPEGRDDERQEERHLEGEATFSPRGVDLLAKHIEFDASWRRVIDEYQVVTLEGEPTDDIFPGLEPFWEEHPDGEVTIVPVSANQTAIGALILGDVESDRELGLGREGLRAMALHFGSALENARLFEKVKSAHDSLQETQDQLVHAEKFAAVGILAAEIAHEINNPASFVISNLSVMDEYAESITSFLDELEERITEEAPEVEEAFEELKQEYDVEYLRDDMDSLLSRSLSGMQRIHQIVQDLRYLSRERGEDPGWIELEGLLDATVNLVRHEAKFRAEIDRDYGDVPQVMSDANRLSQVFLNLLMNAVQAIESGDVADNYVRISTSREDDSVVVSVEDSGTGIPADVRGRIFEPFFSTKETGEGTGLGLSISQDIVRSLGGEIDYESEPGEGTTFVVRIPIRAQKFQEDRELRDSGYYDTPPGLDKVPEELLDP